MQNSRSFPVLDQLPLWTLLVTTLLLPLLVLPFTEQIVAHAKLYLWLVAMIGILALFTLSSLRSRVIRVLLSPFSLPLLLLGISALMSSFLTGDYPVEHLLGMGGAYVATAVIALLSGSLIKNVKAGQFFLTTLVISGIVLTLSSVLQLLGVGPSMLLSRVLPISVTNTLLFNLAGSSLVATQFLLVTLVGLVTYALTHKRVAIFHLVAGAVLLIGIGIHGWSMLPGQIAQPLLPPFTASWSVATDMLKAPRSALIGAGPEGFINAYTQLKPVWINGSERMWNVRFPQGSNVPLTIIVSMGLLGLAAWLFLAYRVVRQTREVNKEGRFLQYMLLVLFGLQLILPVSVVMLALMGLVIVFLTVVERDRFSEVEIHGLTVRFVKSRAAVQPLTSHVKLVLYTFVTVMAVVVLGLGYMVGRAYAAQIAMFEAFKAAQNNNAVEVYLNQQRAVQLNPYLDNIRRQYAVTNITIASALAQNAERTEVENQQFSQLIQQAIREGRAATLLDPNDVSNWVVLAQIYRPLIGVADGADQWTVNSYVSAINAAPNDPNLRVELGGVFYGQEQYGEAITFFQQAVNLKNDFTNGYYNLANAYSMAEQYENAKLAYQQTLLLLEPDSEDYIRTSEELAAVEEKIPEQPQAEGEAGQETGAPSVINENVNVTPQEAVSPPTDEVNIAPGVSGDTQTPGEEGTGTGQPQEVNPAVQDSDL